MILQLLFPGHPFPAERHVQRFRRLFIGAGKRCAFVERHHHVRSQRPLDRHRFPRPEKEPGPVDVRGELHPVRLHLPQIGETEHLKSSAVGQNRMVPVLKRMKPSRLLDQLGPGTQKQVIGVPQNNLDIQLLQLAGRHRLDRPPRPHRHEYRRVDNPVGGFQPSQTRPGGGILMQKFKVVHLRAQAFAV